MNLPVPYRTGLLALMGTSAFGAVVLAGGASGCTVLTNDAPPDDAGVFEGGDAATATCSPCVASECTAPWALCLTNESCLSVRQCATATGCDGACGTACACAPADGGLRGGKLFRTFASCNDARTCTDCSSDCATSCSNGNAKTTAPGTCDEADASAMDAGDDAATAIDGGEDAATPPVDCSTCAANACGSAKAACAVGTECAAFLECAFDCADAACVTQCDALHATGKVAAVELASCTQTSCENECGL